MKSVIENGMATIALSAMSFVARPAQEAVYLPAHVAVPELYTTDLSANQLTPLPIAEVSVDTQAADTNNEAANKLLIWGGIAACLATSAALSGMTLGVFSVSRLRLSLLASQGDESAKKVLGMRQDSNTTLSTLVWANVGTNSALTLLSDNALSGITGLAFSVGAITLLGEIIPQAYFSRHALNMGAKLEPFFKLLNTALYPLAKPCGMLLDKMVGEDAIEYFREQDLKELLKMHVHGTNGEIGAVEATGSANFLALDDISVAEEGEALDQASILYVPLRDGQLDLPDFEANPDDPVLRRIQESGKKWVVFCQPDGTPRKVLDANAFLRDVLFEREKPQPNDYWHKPIIVTNAQEKLGDLLTRLHVQAEHHDDDVIDNDVILFWSEDQKRIITGSDILGRMFRGIAKASIVAPSASKDK